MNLMFALRYFLILIISFAVQQTCAMVPDAIDIIGSDRIQLLKHFGDDDLHVRILYGEVNGVSRAVVLIGQNFVKSENAVNRELELLSLSPLRGFEGYVFTSDLATWTIEPLYRFTNLILHYYVAIVSIMSRGYSVDVCSTMGKGYFIECYEKDGSVTVTPDNPKVADKVNIMLEAGGSEWVTAANLSIIPVFISLGLSEVASKIFSINIQINAGSPLVCLFLAIYGVTHYLQLQRSYFLYKLAAYHLFGESTSVLFPYIFPMYYWIQDYRDELMARNIFGTFILRPGDQDMMVSVFRFNVAGIARFLTQKHNFVDITDKVLYEQPED